MKRRPDKPDEPDGQARGGGGRPKGGGDDGSRGESLAITDEVVETRDAAGDLAATILSQPTEFQLHAAEQSTPSAATARTDQATPASDGLGRSTNDERDDRAREMDGRSGRPDGAARDRATQEPEREEQSEDLSIREARDSFERERDDDGLGM